MPKKSSKILGHFSFLILRRTDRHQIRVALASIQFDDDGRMTSFKIPMRIDRG